MVYFITGKRSKRREMLRHGNGGCRNDRRRRLSWREHGSLQVCGTQTLQVELGN
jgi:hypothetical protein